MNLEFYFTANRKDKRLILFYSSIETWITATAIFFFLCETGAYEPRALCAPVVRRPNGVAPHRHVRTTQGGRLEPPTTADGRGRDFVLRRVERASVLSPPLSTDDTRGIAGGEGDDIRSWRYDVIVMTTTRGEYRATTPAVAVHSAAHSDSDDVIMMYYNHTRARLLRLDDDPHPIVRRYLVDLLITSRVIYLFFLFALCPQERSYRGCETFRINTRRHTHAHALDRVSWEGHDDDDDDDDADDSHAAVLFHLFFFLLVAVTKPHLSVRAVRLLSPPPPPHGSPSPAAGVYRRRRDVRTTPKNCAARRAAMTISAQQAGARVALRAPKYTCAHSYRRRYIVASVRVRRAITCYRVEISFGFERSTRHDGCNRKKIISRTRDRAAVSHGRQLTVINTHAHTFQTVIILLLLLYVRGVRCETVGQSFSHALVSAWYESSLPPLYITYHYRYRRSSLHAGWEQTFAPPRLRDPRNVGYVHAQRCFGKN